MIQLGYYSQQQSQLDESNDFENYDPSEFLLKKEEAAAPPPVVQEQMQYQQEYYPNIPDGASGGDELSQQNFYSSFSQQSFTTSDYNFQQPQVQEDLSLSQPAPIIGSGLDDLDISDSDDDDQANTSNNQADTSKEDDDGLWF